MPNRVPNRRSAPKGQSKVAPSNPACPVKVAQPNRGAELHMRAQRIPERGVGGQPGFVRRRHVQLDEPLAL